MDEEDATKAIKLRLSEKSPESTETQVVAKLLRAEESGTVLRGTSVGMPKKNRVLSACDQKYYIED